MNNKEELLFKLLLDASDALQELSNLDKNTKEYGLGVEKVSNLMKGFAQTSEMSLNAAEKGMYDLITSTRVSTAELEKMRASMVDVRALNAQSPVLGAMNGPAAPTASQRLGMDVAGIGAMPQTVDAMAETLKKLKSTNPSSTFTEIGNAMRKAGADSEVLEKATKKLKPAAENAGKGFSVLRSAMGFLTAMAMSALANAVTQAFKKIIDSASQLEQAYIKIGIAERSLSLAGVDITPKDLDDIAKSVTATYSTISKIDSLKMVSNLAVLTKDLKLSAEQYKQLALSIPLVAQQGNVSIESATEQVITGLTKSGRGWADLGITVDAEIIKQEAVNSGLVANREAYENLTAEQKQQVEVLALINILNENTAGNLQDQDKYLESIAGKQAAVNKEMENFSTLAGVFGSPLMKQGLNVAITGVRVLYLALVGVSVALATVGAGIVAIGTLMSGNISSAKEFVAVFKSAQTDIVNSLLSTDGIAPSPEDTPPGLGDNGEGGDPEDDKRQEALDKYAQELVETEIKAAQEREDIAIELGRDLEDIESEFGKKRVDANNEYLNDILDINNSYNEEINDIKEEQFQLEQEYRNDDLKRERDYQNKLLEMKEEYLTNLEDALHTRDAGQVLRLMRDYELEKTQAARNYELDKLDAEAQKQQDQKELQHKVEQAKRTRDIALAAAAKERDDKLAQLALEEKEEIAQAKLKAERKLEDLQKSNSDKMALLAANLAQEYKLSGAWVERMTKLYLKYYKDVGQIYANIAKMKQMAEMAAGTVGAVRPAGTPTQSNQILTKPTKTQSLDKSLPQSRLGKGVGGSSVAGSTGSLNKISIELLLSPDLESRIISSTLDQTAEVFTQVQRGR